MVKNNRTCRCCGERLRVTEEKVCEECNSGINRKIAVNYLKGYHNFWREARGKVDDYLKTN